nr:MAG TPA: hypothetical protein [Caudoviricetes sp.]
MGWLDGLQPKIDRKRLSVLQLAPQKTIGDRG